MMKQKIGVLGTIKPYFLEGVKDGFMIYEEYLCKEGPNKGKHMRTNEKWYPKLEMALTRMLDFKLSSSSASCIKELRKEVITLRGDIKKFVEELGE